MNNDALIEQDILSIIQLAVSWVLIIYQQGWINGVFKIFREWIPEYVKSLKIFSHSLALLICNSWQTKRIPRNIIMSRQHCALVVRPSTILLCYCFDYEHPWLHNQDFIISKSLCFWLSRNLCMANINDNG